MTAMSASMIRFQDIGQTLAPLVLVAEPGISARQVVLRDEGPDGPLRSALARDLGPHQLDGIEPELERDERAVAGQPFVVDDVVLHRAIGDGAKAELAVGRRAIGAIAALAAGRDGAVRRQVSRLVVARPDDVLGQDRAVGAFAQRRHRVRDDACIPFDQPAGGAQDDVGIVVAMQRGDPAILPRSPW